MIEIRGLKKKLRSAICRYYAARHGASVIVASMGRCGSTLMTEAVAASLVGSLGRRIFIRHSANQLIRYHWTLSTLSPQRGLVYKTHDRPATGLPPHCRSIYTFGDPFDVIASLHKQRQTLGEDWMQLHAVHMVRHEIDVDRMYSEDVYELEANFDAWMQSTIPNTLLIRYDKIWHYQNEISSFLGFNLELPAYVSRESHFDKLDARVQEQVKYTYKSLREKVLDSSLVVR